VQAGTSPTQLLVEEEELEQYFYAWWEWRCSMTDLKNALWIELRKAVRSRVPLFTSSAT